MKSLVVLVTVLAFGNLVFGSYLLWIGNPAGFVATAGGAGAFVFLMVSQRYRGRAEAHHQNAEKLRELYTRVERTLR